MMDVATLSVKVLLFRWSSMSDSRQLRFVRGGIVEG